MPKFEILDIRSIRLPCSNFTLVIRPSFRHLFLAVEITTSGMVSSHSVTCGMYKVQKRIHRCIVDRRLLAISTSCKRVAAYNPNLGQDFGVNPKVTILTNN